jgi:signal transduction histidine kinase
VKLWADADRITQTLTNLIGNAIKFSPAGSTIDVAIAVIGGEALFEVRDRGRGIPPEKLESIFERFQQVDTSDAREKGGTGLGLAISRGIVKQHGGRIWAENNPPSIGGSVFKFTVPLRSPPPAINSSAAEDAPPASSPEGLVARMARSLTIAALNPRVAR